MSRVASAFERFDRAELSLCRYLNRSSVFPSIRTLFRCVSWLGDGWLWYAIIVGIVLASPREGLAQACQLIAMGAIGVVVYKSIKQKAFRERPFITHCVIHRGAVPLDRYSFPSGHTLHAVSFSILLAAYFPQFAAPLTAFTLLVALSRVVLGLHYPTDVVAGAMIGAALGGLNVYIATAWTGL